MKHRVWKKNKHSIDKIIRKAKRISYERAKWLKHFTKYYYDGPLPHMVDLGTITKDYKVKIKYNNFYLPYFVDSSNKEFAYIEYMPEIDNKLKDRILIRDRLLKHTFFNKNLYYEGILYNPSIRISNKGFGYKLAKEAYDYYLNKLNISNNDKIKLFKACKFIYPFRYRFIDVNISNNYDDDDNIIYIPIPIIPNNKKYLNSEIIKNKYEEITKSCLEVRI